MKFLALMLAAAGLASCAPVQANDPSKPHALVHVLLPDGRVLADRMYYDLSSPAVVFSNSQLANKNLKAKAVKIVNWMNGARPLGIECNAWWDVMAHPVYMYMGGADEVPTNKFNNLDLGNGVQHPLLQGYSCEVMPSP